MDSREFVDLALAFAYVAATIVLARIQSKDAQVRLWIYLLMAFCAIRGTDRMLQVFHQGSLQFGLDVLLFFVLSGIVVTTNAASARLRTLDSDSSHRQIQLNLVFNAVSDGIWIVDDKGITVLVNPAAQRLPGFTADQLAGRSSHEMIHHHHRDGMAYEIESCPIYRSVFHNKPCLVDDEVFWRADGTSFPVTYSSAPIIDASDVTIGAVQVFRDLSLQIEAREIELRLAAAEVAQVKALELNDNVVQRLAVADLALSMGLQEQAVEAIHVALTEGKRIISEWSDGPLVRELAAAGAEPDLISAVPIVATAIETSDSV
ncbi:MAG: PAS domain S-box protein [Thermoleophilia bacterium]|nr:PAS domain S-box protein [Thermoleophilia bacterium]